MPAQNSEFGSLSGLSGRRIVIRRERCGASACHIWNCRGNSARPLTGRPFGGMIHCERGCIMARCLRFALVLLVAVLAGLPVRAASRAVPVSPPAACAEATNEGIHRSCSYSSGAYPSWDHHLMLVDPQQASRLFLPVVIGNHPPCIAAGELIYWYTDDRCCAGLVEISLAQPCDPPGVGACGIDGCSPIPPCACSICAPCGDGVCQPEYRENRCNCSSDCG